jgi:hypothetical protein
MASASSSMADSVANVLSCPPSERSDDVRIGMVSSRWTVTSTLPKS